MKRFLLAATLALFALPASAFTVEIYRPSTLLNKIPVAIESNSTTAMAGSDNAHRPHHGDTPDA